jgi:hypothetical protein
MRSSQQVYRIKQRFTLKAADFKRFSKLITVLDELLNG